MTLLTLLSGAGGPTPSTLEDEAERLLAFLDDTDAEKVYALGMHLVDAVRDAPVDEEAVRRAFLALESNVGGLEAIIKEAIDRSLAGLGSQIAQLATAHQSRDEAVAAAVTHVPLAKRKRVAVAVSIFFAACASDGVAIWQAAHGQTISVVTGLATSLTLLAMLLQHDG